MDVDMFFSEMLPVVLDSSVLDEYGISSDYSYDSTLDASMIQAFTIAYR